jgi:YesN/AraC family two-component response regulator
MKPSILIVDDEKLICMTLERMLSPDYAIYKASNGQEGLDIIRGNGNIDIVLSDIIMPVMDGFEMIETVRSENPDIIIIAMTAIHSGKNVTKVMEKGADAYLLKPFDINQLEKTIKKLLKNKLQNRTDSR